VDDMTRTTPVSKIMPYVLEELAEAGISREQITILLALGAHRPMNRQDCLLKLGKDVVDTINIENHSPYENLTQCGESAKGTPIDINTTYLESDLKITIGGVIPHPLAGFGGGAKMVLPGVSGIRTLEANHASMMRGIGIGIGKVTELRKDIEDTAGRVGLDFSINVVFTEDGAIAGITSGHFIDAHRKAMEIGKHVYLTPIKPEHLESDVCFFNLFPEDSELSQSAKGFNLLMMAPDSMLQKKGSIVMMSSAYEGRGYHCLIAETGAKLRIHMGESILWEKLTGERNVFLCSPNISKLDLYHFFPKSVQLFETWHELIQALMQIHGAAPKALVFPCSIQLCAPDGGPKSTNP